MSTSTFLSNLCVGCTTVKTFSKNLVKIKYSKTCLKFHEVHLHQRVNDGADFALYRRETLCRNLVPHIDDAWLKKFTLFPFPRDTMFCEKVQDSFENPHAIYSILSSNYDVIYIVSYRKTSSSTLCIIHWCTASSLAMSSGSFWYS